MKCPYCDAHLEDGSQACAYCGADVSPNAISHTSHSTVPMDEPLPPDFPYKTPEPEEPAAPVEPAAPPVERPDVFPPSSPDLFPPAVSAVVDAVKDRSPLAIAGLVLGIISLCSWIGMLCSLPLPILGLVLSVMGMRSRRRGMAIGGVVLNVLGILIVVIATVLLGAAWFSNSGSWPTP